MLILRSNLKIKISVNTNLKSDVTNRRRFKVFAFLIRFDSLFTRKLDKSAKNTARHETGIKVLCEKNLTYYQAFFSKKFFSERRTKSIKKSVLLLDYQHYKVHIYVRLLESLRKLFHYINILRH